MVSTVASQQQGVLSAIKSDCSLHACLGFLRFPQIQQNPVGAKTVTGADKTMVILFSTLIIRMPCLVCLSVGPVIDWWPVRILRSQDEQLVTHYNTIFHKNQTATQRQLVKNQYNFTTFMGIRSVTCCLLLYINCIWLSAHQQMNSLIKNRILVFFCPQMNSELRLYC